MNVLATGPGGRLDPQGEGMFLADRGERSGGSEIFRRDAFVKALGVVRKYKWWIAGIVTLCAILGLIATLLTTPQYTASAVIEIRRETQNFTNVSGADENPRQGLDPEYYQTQLGLLQSESLARRVGTALKLADDASFYQAFAPKLAEQWFANGKLVANAPPRAERERFVAQILVSRLKIGSERLSRLVTISFTSPDPALSKRVVDAWSVNFIDATLQRKYDATAYARKFLQDRLGQLRARIDESERQLVSYARQEGIINLPLGSEDKEGGSSGGGARSLTVADLTALNAELAKATADRIAAESRLRASSGTAEALNNQAVTALRGRRAELNAEYAKLMEQFEPSYPPARALRQQIAQIERSIATEEGRVGQSLSEAYRAAQNREQQLAARVESLKTGVLDQRQRSIQYDVLQREVNTNTQLYDALLQRFKEIGVAGGIGVNNISIIDPAELPQGPSSPSLVRNMALALLIGLALSGVVVLVLEQLSDAIDDPSEVTQELGLPLLGMVPKDIDGNVAEKIADPKEMLSESYISLRTALGFSTEHGFPRSLAFTSSRPAEGKSTSAYAIAMALARPERRVLLIDADMRSPSMHQMFGLPASGGLSNYLAGNDDIETLIAPTPNTGLHLLAAGPQPPNAADLLASDRFGALIAQLTQRYDHVIVDAPPVMGLADAPLIASKVEGVVYVVEAHVTGKSVVRSAMARLQSAHARLLGVIISKFDAKRAHYGYGYNYGYGYGYGSDEDAKR